MAKCRECGGLAFQVNSDNLIHGIGPKVFVYRCITDPEHQYDVPIPPRPLSMPLKRGRPLQWRKVHADG